MKTSFTLLGLTVLLTFSLYADSASIIKQHAKELVNENNVRQGVPPPTQSGTPGASSGPAAQSPAISRLGSDLAALKSGSEITAEQKQKLANDIVAAAETAAKPTAASAKKLADDIAAACSDKPLPATSRSRLVMELDAVLNPSRYPQAKLDGIYGDVQAVFQENGTPRNQAMQVSTDVKAIAGEVRK